MAEQTIDNVQQVKPTVLITGGSGLIGRQLTALLLQKGFSVSCLSRTKSTSGKAKVYTWDPGNKKIDISAFMGADYIVHLAGANIGEQRWTRARKQDIIESRSGSARLLFKYSTLSGSRLRGFISASAIGIYGTGASDKIYSEADPPGNDFLGHVCRDWEGAADLFSASGIRTVKIRTGVVLDKNDSALAKLMQPGKYGFLLRIGSGRQFMPWIHLNDLCEIYLKAITDETMSGAYNAVAPQHVTHGEFMKTLGSVMGRPVLPIPVPGLLVRAALGEMSGVVLKGSRISADKIMAAGYDFHYKSVEEALKNILK